MMMKNQSGNVFFYIFLAVALFAALSYAVSQSGRGTVQSIASEKDRLNATEILDYAETMAKAVGAMRLRGITPENISFAHADLAGGYGVPGAKPEAELFDPEGGNIVLRLPPDGIMAASQNFGFTGTSEVENVGATCAQASCADLLVYLKGLNRDGCITINKLLKIDNPSGEPPQENAFAVTPYAGTFGYDQTIGSGSPLSGKLTGCFYVDQPNPTPDDYYFYRVLIAR
jgi:hypothetical protein